MVPLAIGSQTNGSTIRPAAFCGVYGVKPSHGMISRAGALMLSRSLDHVGVFARTLADAALLLDVLAGYDPDDADTRLVAAPSFLETLAEPPPLPPRLAFEPFAAAWDDQRAIMAADMAHNLGQVVARGGEASSRALCAIIAEGREVSAVRYLTAHDAARRYKAGLAEVFTQYDAILTPAAPGVAPKGEATGNPAFCTLWTLTGLPAVTLPLLTGEGGMPLGVQLIGAAGDDARLLRSANWLTMTLDG
jgi:Asp-tRNA(Asn)/Glu-tRNA(Gln) amidotransferase A subunit family amidase